MSGVVSQLAELTRLLMRDMPEKQEEIVGQQTPQEMEDFLLWQVNRGLFDTKRHLYTGDPAVWIAERLKWALAHGWPGGAEAFFAWEDPAEDEPRDASEI